MLPLGIIGATGRTGSIILQEIAKHPAVTCVAAINSSNPLTNLATIDFAALIDISTIQALPKNVEFAVRHKLPLVIGTTGLEEKEQLLLEQAAKVIPLLYAANFSITVNVLYKLLKMASQLLPNHEVAIEEIHHKNKKDAPSGTALTMAKWLGRPCPINSLRLGEILGEHSALFVSPDDILTITHRSNSRSGYGQGAIAAALWLVQQPAGLYDMQSILDK